MLHQTLSEMKSWLGGDDCYREGVPGFTVSNLNQRFELRPYQLEALGRFCYYLENGNSPSHHILFQMATGSGKTLIMAALILYLYQRGFRNFLFFVNRENIIHKTRDNFLNLASPKFLFNESIEIDCRRISMREVSNFQATNSEEINIAFSTVQGLHSRLNNPRENSVTYEEFESKEIVLISDEAHHINVHTQGISSNSNWELTVDRIFKSNDQNILLEFTATMDFTNESIVEKYRDKIIMNYPLRKFRSDGYSKEVKVLQSEVSRYDRSLQAMILSQYRRKLFNEISTFIKPVILFKSRTIDESRLFREEFSEQTRKLTGEKLASIRDNAKSDSILFFAFRHFNNNNISLDNLALELKEEFSENKCITIDSKKESIENQIIVNTLEAKNNQIRAVFAVSKLDEGWDVLNLFDIVRLYDTRDSRNNRPGRTTVSEAQLIGRGARYCPFRVSETQPLYQRKFDAANDEELELKICEELYYHSANNPRYIQELKVALCETGILSDESIERKLVIKPQFKNKEFYQSGAVYINKRLPYDRQDVTGIDPHFIQNNHRFRLRSGYSQESTLMNYRFRDVEQFSVKTIKLRSFGTRVIRKAMCQQTQYRFNNLRRNFPNLKSVSEFIDSECYLGNISIDVELPQSRTKELNQEEKLFLARSLLKRLTTIFHDRSESYRGTSEFMAHPIRKVFVDKDVAFCN